MESFLNIVWVIASVLIAGTGVTHFLRRATRTHSIGTVVVALIALSVLLFPVISLTDDLHATLFAFEDVSRKVAMLSLLHAPAATVATVVATTMEVLCASTALWQIHQSAPAPMELAGFGQAISDRAPPVLA